VVDKFRELQEAADMQFPGAPERVRMHEIVRGLINWLVTGLMEGTVAAAGDLGDVDQVRDRSFRIARFSSETAGGTAQLKALLRETVYDSPGLVAARRESAERIELLFQCFMEDPGRLPANYLEDSAGQPMHRRVCDYIAGMTDRFLLKTCEQMKICI
jgi:dGTPase